MNLLSMHLRFLKHQSKIISKIKNYSKDISRHNNKFLTQNLNRVQTLDSIEYHINSTLTRSSQEISVISQYLRQMMLDLKILISFLHNSHKISKLVHLILKIIQRESHLFILSQLAKSMVQLVLASTQEIHSMIPNLKTKE
jgi:predicted PurR-regulated permease PerM